MKGKKKRSETRTLYNGPFVLSDAQHRRSLHFPQPRTRVLYNGFFLPPANQRNGNSSSRAPQFAQYSPWSPYGQFYQQPIPKDGNLPPYSVQRMQNQPAYHPQSDFRMKYTSSSPVMRPDLRTVYRPAVVPQLQTREENVPVFCSQQNVRVEDKQTSVLARESVWHQRPVMPVMHNNTHQPVCSPNCSEENSYDVIDINNNAISYARAGPLYPSDNSCPCTEQNIDGMVNQQDSNSKSSAPHENMHPEENHVNCADFRNQQDISPHRSYNPYMDLERCIPLTNAALGNNDSLYGVNLLEEILKPVHVKWRKATHGYVREYFTDVRKICNPQGSRDHLKSSPLSCMDAHQNPRPRQINSPSVSPIRGDQDNHHDHETLKKDESMMNSTTAANTSKLTVQTGEMMGRWREDHRKRSFDPAHYRVHGASPPKQPRVSREDDRYFSDRHRYRHPEPLLPPPCPPSPPPRLPPLLPTPPSPTRLPPLRGNRYDALDEYYDLLPPRDYPPYPPIDYCLISPRDFSPPPYLPPLPRRRQPPPPPYFDEDQNYKPSIRPLLEDDLDFTEDFDFERASPKEYEHRGARRDQPRGYLQSNRRPLRSRGLYSVRGHPRGNGPVISRGPHNVRGQGHVRGQMNGNSRGSLRGYQRGRGRGGICGRGDQPSQSANPATIPETQNVFRAIDRVSLSASEKLQEFINKLKEFPEKENAILTIENCITASHTPVKSYFTVEELPSNSLKKPIFSGALFLDNIFITRSTSTGKKMLKHTVYESALILLKTKSVSELLAQEDTAPSIPRCHEQPVTEPEDFKTKLLKLQDKIKASKHEEDQPVMIFDGAIVESRCGLTRDYDVEVIRTERGIPMYTKTSLLLEGKVLATAVALNKKDSKSRVCQKAVQMFRTKEVDKIVEECFGNNEPEEEIPPAIQEMIKKHRETQQASKTPSLLTEQELADLLDRMITELKAPVKNGTNTIMIIDKNCVQLKIKLLAIYKTDKSQKEKLHITCDLYIVDRFIAQGTGLTRKQAQADAYSKGGEILRRSTGKDLLTSFPKFKDSELKEKNVMDVVYKGYSKVYESNLCRLNRLRQLPEEKRKVSELIIIEHENWVEDRKKHALCILTQSATQCGCLLEWTTEPENGCFRCTMTLQGQQLTTVVAKQRKAAVNLASGIALFRLYETQPVVQGFQADYSKIWITRQQLVEISGQLVDGSEACGGDLIQAVAEVDEKIAAAMEQMLDQFFSQPTVAEFVAAPEWRPEEKKHLRTLATSRGLRVTAENYCEEQLVVVSKKYNLLEIVNILKQQPNQSQGRYCLLPAKAKPSYNDIAGEVAANESIIKTYGAASGPSNLDKDLVIEYAEEELDNNSSDGDDIVLSPESDREDVFVTANSTISPTSQTVENSVKCESVVTMETTPPIVLSDIPLPKSTSTPSDTPKRKTSAVVEKESCNIRDSKCSRWDKTTKGVDTSQSPVQPQANSTGMFKTPPQFPAAITTATPEPPSPSTSLFLSAPSGQSLGVKKPPEPSPASLSQEWSNMSRGGQYAAIPPLPLLSVPPQPPVHDRSFDVEAGLGRPWAHDQFSPQPNQFSGVPVLPPQLPPLPTSGQSLGHCQQQQQQQQWQQQPQQQEQQQWPQQQYQWPQQQQLQWQQQHQQQHQQQQQSQQQQEHPQQQQQQWPQQPFQEQQQWPQQLQQQQQWPQQPLQQQQQQWHQEQQQQQQWPQQQQLPYHNQANLQYQGFQQGQAGPFPPYLAYFNTCNET